MTKYAADTWLRFISFSCLENFEIGNCAGADVVFTQLSKPHMRPTKLKSIRWMDDNKSETHALEAFEGLLESLSGLLTIHVFINRMRALPKISAIIPHKKTLTSLSIHSQLSTQTPAHTYLEDDYSRLCTECGELRQLSIMFPKTAIETLPSRDFLNFVVCLLQSHGLQ